MRDLGLDEDKVNVNGGAIALGHPIGMSGARIALHLALELQRRGGGVGAAALCGGGGQGDALIMRVPACLSSRLTLRDAGAGRRRPGRAGPGRATPRAVARLISLVEDASPAAARGDGGAGAVRRPRARHRADRRARRRASRRPRARW